MKLAYDPQADAARLDLGPAIVDESEEVMPGVVFDFDAGGRIVGIEVLNASVRLPQSVLVPEAA